MEVVPRTSGGAMSTHTQESKNPMSEQQNRRDDNPPNRSSELEDIPVEELIRMTREFTRRITNQDRQRLGVELRESGHQRTIKLSAPVTLQQFFSGEIDLDTDLARRFTNAPLLSSTKFIAGAGQSVHRRATTIFSSNDDSTALTIDAHDDEDATLDFTFTLFSTLAQRFRLTPLSVSERQRWLDLMRRSNGITFLWTHRRWEAPHLIFVVREHFGRVYAFSPEGIEAAARLTPDTILNMVDWLEDVWFPGQREAREAAAKLAEQPDADDSFGDFIESPSHMRRPSSRHRKTLRDAIPDAPEEQWEDAPTEPKPADWSVRLENALSPTPDPSPPVEEFDAAAEGDFEDDFSGDDFSGELSDEDLEW